MPTSYKCVCISDTRGEEALQVHLRSLDNRGNLGMTLLPQAGVQVISCTCIRVPAGEGVVECPGQSGPVGWQRCLHPSVGYRIMLKSSFLHTAICDRVRGNRPYVTGSDF